MTPSLEFAFQIQVYLGDALHLENTATGGRGFRPVLHGEITGPLLQGKVLPHTGGDYPLLRRDGVASFDARYLLQATDGTLILLRNRGYRHGESSAMAGLVRGEKVDPAAYYMRLAPEFEVPEGPHDWLTKHLFVGAGVRDPEFATHRYYVVR